MPNNIKSARYYPEDSDDDTLLTVAFVERVIVTGDVYDYLVNADFVYMVRKTEKKVKPYLLAQLLKPKGYELYLNEPGDMASTTELYDCVQFMNERHVNYGYCISPSFRYDLTPTEHGLKLIIKKGCIGKDDRYDWFYWLRKEGKKVDRKFIDHLVRPWGMKVKAS